MTVTERQQLSYIAAQAADARVNLEIETEGMTLNIGPQHPATHGTLRIVAKLDGEQVVAAEPVMGYMHRGYEKLAEVRTYPQVTTPDQPHRLAGQLRQRGAVHPGRRAAHGGGGPAPGPVDPHHPLRAEPHRQHHAVPGRHGGAGGGHHPGVLRLPGPRACPQPDRGPPPAGASIPTSTASAASRTTSRPAGWPRPARPCARSAPSATRSRSWSRATRSSRPAPGASA